MRRLPVFILWLTSAFLSIGICHADDISDITKDFNDGVDALKTAVDKVAKDGELKSAFSAGNIRGSKEAFKKLANDALSSSSPLHYSGKTFKSRSEKFKGLKEASKKMKDGLIGASEQPKLSVLFEKGVSKLDMTKIVTELLEEVAGALPAPYGTVGGGVMKLFNNIYAAAKPTKSEYDKLKDDLSNNFQDMVDKKLLHDKAAGEIAHMIDVMELVDGNPDKAWSEKVFNFNVQKPEKVNKLLAELKKNFNDYVDDNTFSAGRRALKCACSYAELARQRDTMWKKVIGKMAISPELTSDMQTNMENWQKNEHKEWTFLNIFNREKWWEEGAKFFSAMFAYNLPTKDTYECAQNLKEFLKEVRTKALLAPSDYATPPPERTNILARYTWRSNKEWWLATFWLNEDDERDFLSLNMRGPNGDEPPAYLAKKGYQSRFFTNQHTGAFYFEHADTNRYRIVLRNCYYSGQQCYLRCGWIKEVGGKKDEQSNWKCTFTGNDRKSGAPPDKTATLFTFFKAGEFRGTPVLMFGPSFPDALPGGSKNSDPDYKYQYIFGGNDMGRQCSRLTTHYGCWAGHMGNSIEAEELQQDRKNNKYMEYDESKMYWDDAEDDDYLQSWLWRLTDKPIPTKAD